MEAVFFQRAIQACTGGGVEGVYSTGPKHDFFIFWGLGGATEPKVAILIDFINFLTPF